MNCDKLKGRIMKVLNEAFDIDDMDNEIVDIPRSKQSIRKESKMYGKVRRLITKGYDFTTCLSNQLSLDDIEIIDMLFNNPQSVDKDAIDLFMTLDELSRRNLHYYAHMGILVDKIQNKTKFDAFDDEVAAALQEIDSREHPLYASYAFQTHDEDFDAFFDFIGKSIRYLGYDANLNWIDMHNADNIGHLFSSNYEYYDGNEVYNAPNNRFTGDISLWDVSNVTCMEETFLCSAFNGDISQWDVSNVTTMYRMFALSTFNGDLASWGDKLGNMEQMSEMFKYARYKGNLSNWNIPHDCDIENMFNSCDIDDTLKPSACRMAVNEAFDIEDLGGSLPATETRKEKVSKHSRLYGYLDNMFSTMSVGDIKAFDREVSDDDRELLKEIYVGFDTIDDDIRQLIKDKGLERLLYYIAYVYPTMIRLIKKLISLTDLDMNDRKFIKDIVNNIKTKNDPLYAYYKMETNLDIWDNNVAKDLNRFVRCLDRMHLNSLNLNWIDVGQIKSMERLFQTNANFNGDISLWDVRNVRDFSYMFTGSKFSGDISEWKFDNAETMDYMFSASKFDGDISRWKFPKVKTMVGMFFNSQFNGDVSGWEFPEVWDMRQMFCAS